MGGGIPLSVRGMKCLAEVGAGIGAQYKGFQHTPPAEPITHIFPSPSPPSPLHQDVTGRFNERLILSLASCHHCLMMDDELNVLPTSSLIKYIEPVRGGG